jgi:hypothetical protein
MTMPVTNILAYYNIMYTTWRVLWYICIHYQTNKKILYMYTYVLDQETHGLIIWKGLNYLSKKFISRGAVLTTLFYITNEWAQ